jgi:hypothetical protein
MMLKQKFKENYMKQLLLILSLIMVAPMANAKDISVTPSISTLNFPHPLDLGLELTFADVFGVKVQQSLRPSYNRDDVDGKINDFMVQARVYPLLSGWFIGAGYGHHSLEGHRFQNINGFDTDIYANADASYFMPSTGYKFVFNCGFTMGFELGWIFPNNGTGSVTSNQDNNPAVANNAEYQQRRADAERTVTDYANKGLPSVGLFELGWTF